MEFIAESAFSSRPKSTSKAKLQGSEQASTLVAFVANG